MRVLVAGASGAIGMPLVRSLRAAGHDVIAIHRTPSGAERLSAAGAACVRADEPVAMAALLTATAEAVGAPRAVTVPSWLLAAAPYARVVVGGGLRVSSAKAKAELGWQPQVRTYRDGMRLLAAHYRSQPEERTGPSRRRRESKKILSITY